MQSQAKLAAVTLETRKKREKIEKSFILEMLIGVDCSSWVFCEYHCYEGIQSRLI